MTTKIVEGVLREALAPYVQGRCLMGSNCEFPECECTNITVSDSDAVSAMSAVRAAALKEAAEVADKTPDEILVLYPRGPTSPPGNMLTQVRGQRLIAQAIRSLIPKDEK